MSITH